MALIEVFHVVASNLPVDNTDTTVEIPQGILVTLATDGTVVTAHGGSNAMTVEDVGHAIGLAGDTKTHTGTTSFTPESGSALSKNPEGLGIGGLVTGAWGAAQRFTQNRVADNYNESLASGKLTVYHSGGEFWTDQYEVVDEHGAICQYVPASNLYASTVEAVAGADLVARHGRFTSDGPTDLAIVGAVLNGPEDYPSGVPGTDVGFTALPEGGNSLSWGQFLHVKLIL